MFTNNRLICGAFISVIIAGCNGSLESHVSDDRQSASTIEKYGAQIDKIFTNFSDDTPGIAVAVSRNGDVVFQKGYGKANLEYSTPITVDTTFDIGSVSKQFTSFSIYLLESRGQLSLDDDIRKYLPEIPDYGTLITIRHLSTHTSGLRDQWSLLTLAGWRMDDVITDEHILRLVSRQSELNFTPGDQFMYSNTGYTLLAEIVARVSGKSFRDFTKEEIFAPLGMDRTQVYDQYSRTVQNRAYSYYWHENEYKKANLNLSNAGPTSVMSSVSDLTKWANNFQTSIVGTPELIKRFNETAALNSGKQAVLPVNSGRTVFVTPGQFKWDYRGTPIYNHRGSTAGFESYLARFPEKDLAVIALTNQANYNVMEAGLDITNIFIEDEVSAVVENQSSAAAPASEQSLPTTHSDFSMFIGSYDNDDLGTSYDVVENNGGISLKHIRHGEIPLVRSAEDEFSGQIVFPVKIKFHRNSHSDITSFSASNFGAKNVLFKRDPEY